MPKPVYDPAVYQYGPESLGPDDAIVATYYFEQAEAPDHLQVVGFMALEASTGGWIDFPGETPAVRAKCSAKVVGYYPVPTPSGSKGAVVQLAFPMEGSAGYGRNLSMLLTAVAGNILAMPGTVRLEDLWLPRAFTAAFPGPRFGVPGMRALLGVPERPLVNMMVKPKIGLTPDLIGTMCYEANLGGVDQIKDDEMAQEVFNCSLEERLKAVMDGLNAASQESGHKTLYTVNITGRGSDLQERARRSVAAGANALMINFPSGLEALRAVAEDPDVNVPILFHPTSSEGAMAVSRVVWAKLARLAGADIYLPGSPWGKWARPEELERTVRARQVLAAPLHDLNPTFALTSAVAGMVPTMVADYGRDTIVGGGGAVHGHPGGVTAGVRAIRQAVDAVMAGSSLEDAAREHPELAQAIKSFGIFQRPTQKRY